MANVAPRSVACLTLEVKLISIFLSVYVANVVWILFNISGTSLINGQSIYMASGLICVFKLYIKVAILTENCSISYCLKYLK